MNILFFTYDFPYPTNSGGKTRAFNLIKFAKRDADITLFSFTRNDFQKEHNDALHALGVHDIFLFPRKSVRDIRNLSSFILSQSIFSTLYFDRGIFDELLRVVREKRIDLVQFESFYTGFYLSDVLRDLGVKQVFGTENIEYILYEDNARYHTDLASRLFFTDQAKKIKREEEAFYMKADSILAVTSQEKEYITSRWKKNVVVIENGVDIADFTQRKQKKRPENTLVFIGNFSYFPNVDAMKWFMHTVFPLLPSDIKLIVVGRNSSKMTFLRHERVQAREYVANIKDAYALGTALIAPIRIGGGTNFKILEAMASGLPVIALAERVGSFDFRDGEELLIASSPQEFVQKTTELLQGVALRRRLAMNAKLAVEKNYNWKNIGNKLHAVWASIINEKY
ncbi:MAG: glycosyltransferase [Candidatus Levybacteria bacterium]|nr:glycosyltransferase [Candidatus Levybacteria bacterium]